MLSDLPSFVFFSLGVIASLIGVQIFNLWRTRKNEESLEAGSLKEREDCVKAVLAALNCTYTEDRGDDATQYKFQYQQGYFYLLLPAASPIVTLWFPAFYVTEAKDIDVVRSICNSLNASQYVYKVFYLIDKKMDQLLLQVTAAFVSVNNVEQLRQHVAELMEGCFDIRRDFDNDYRKLTDAGQKGHDPETEELVNAHELFLLREHEVSHQKTDLAFRPNTTRRLLLGQLLGILYGWKDTHLERLDVITERVDTLRDEAQIRQFDLLRPLIADGQDGTPEFVAREVTLRLACSHATGPDERTSRTVHLVLRPYGRAEHTLYVQISLILLPALQEGSTARIGDGARTNVNSLVVPYDTRSVEAQRAEFAYLWKDAQEKLKNGKRHELTPEQLAICRCKAEPLAFDLYWGNLYFRKKSYYYALLHLENAWRRINEKYAGLRRDERNDFYQLCYQIGYCYDELGMPMKAYYYLDATLPLQRINYTMEYINCLTKARDYRAYPFVVHMLDSLNENANGQVKQLPHNVRSFLNFLRRRKAYLELDSGRLDTAEAALQQMLQEPENADFALTELAHIQHLRRRQKGTDDAPPADATPHAAPPEEE